MFDEYLKKIAEDGYCDEFEKLAKGKDPSWWEKQKGMGRAMRASDKGIGKIFANKKLIKSRYKSMAKSGLKGVGVGAAVGGAAGALLGKKFGVSRKVGAAGGAALAGLIGGDIGTSVGMHKADKKFFAEKGIKLKNLGLSADFSPAARKKYIDKHRKKK